MFVCNLARMQLTVHAVDQAWTLSFRKSGNLGLQLLSFLLTVIEVCEMDQTQSKGSK